MPVMVLVIVVMIMVVMMVMMLLELDIEMHGGDPVLRHVIDLDRIMIVEGELIELGSQMSERHPQLQARTQKHIAADSGKAIKINRIQSQHSVSENDIDEIIMCSMGFVHCSTRFNVQKC